MAVAVKTPGIRDRNSIPRGGQHAQEMSLRNHGDVAGMPPVEGPFRFPMPDEVNAERGLGGLQSGRPFAHFQFLISGRSSPCVVM